MTLREMFDHCSTAEPQELKERLLLNHTHCISYFRRERTGLTTEMRPRLISQASLVVRSISHPDLSPFLELLKLPALVLLILLR